MVNLAGVDLDIVDLYVDVPDVLNQVVVDPNVYDLKVVDQEKVNLGKVDLEGVELKAADLKLVDYAVVSQPVVDRSGGVQRTETEFIHYLVIMEMWKVDNSNFHQGMRDQ